MKLYDIDKLKRDSKQDKLYNLFEMTFQFQEAVNSPLQTYVLSEEQYMRLDLVSQDLYANDGFIDTICNVNSIDNPLNFMANDAILYPNRGLIDTFKMDDVYIEAIPGLALNAEKTTEVDENRKTYVEQNYNLTPTAKDVPKDPVKIIGESIVIGDAI